MAHHLLSLLDSWAEKPQLEWALAVITSVEGSSYRKAGAIMLFDPLGKTLGMLSGGCLEADLRRHAQDAIQTQRIAHITYDATDENDTSYQLGCGGLVNIMMVPLLADNQYLGLPELHQQLTRGNQGHYQLSLNDNKSHAGEMSGKFIASNAAKHDSFEPSSKTQQLTKQITKRISLDGQDYLSVPVRAPYHLGIFGGGLDAQPLAAIAAELDWKITVFDSRSAYARSYDFPAAKINKTPLTQLKTEELTQLDAAVVMNHNLDLDCDALKALQPTNIDYIALLGPGHRRDKVFGLAELTEQDFSGFFSAPAGLALGGELPSSVALSILSQCHGVLHHRISKQAELSRLDKVMS
ncbi:XdhC family protein [Shewanella sp. 1_MG-2023]|uniref:XdhC family protein n=1 Tax=unclassified Shewanella TaxID=196818 RepID=UPI0026E3B285|nr:MULTISPECIES: XdhC/CoxI family protein [unclassified Shewanella]MDO6613633.1 XdhC family protein [Shewanella sp. 7_MG-2023]MDO6773396.1 XdhC family protein [Shewanella sp. 2_MG-2023]MDO6796283.1 XdhC family protein [Shewanella sp. 1_MG-2023]